jgi:4'-phosphopantetheinyl transferase
MINNIPTFIPAPSDFPVPGQSDEIDIWWIQLPSAENPCWNEELDKNEKKLVGEFASSEPRRRFILRRIALRRILARYQMTTPQSLDFIRVPGDKPLLKGHPVVHFNASCCEDRFVIAVSTQCAVGIDIEKIRPMSDLAGVIEMVCSPDEKKLFMSIDSPTDKLSIFLKLWTAKESFLKFTGSGLKEDPSLISFPELVQYPLTIKVTRGKIATSLFEFRGNFISLTTLNINPKINYLVYSDCDFVTESCTPG